MITIQPTINRVNVSPPGQSVIVEEVVNHVIIQTGFQGPKGDPGEPGSGGSLPEGGTTGQILAKASNADGDADWVDADTLAGADGASAYEIAVENGFVGNEAAWLASLVGPTGPQGEPGADGAQGPPGADGADGAQGPPGADGADGANATPITSITDDGSGNLTISTADASFGPFALKGPTGNNGADGAPGADGADGMDGLSAYQIAVNDGFVGDETAWLASLVGDTGPAGADGSDATVNATNVAAVIHGATSKATPVDADELGLIDSAASNALKKLTWANLKATLKTYFDAIYSTFANPMTTAGDIIYGGVSGAGTRLAKGTEGHWLRQGATNPAWTALPAEIQIAASDETTALTTGTGKITFRMPHAMTLTAVRASVTTAPTGSTLVVDINEAGSSILSTKLSIDASEKTSTTAATAAVISDSSLADDAEITIDIDQIGSTIAGAGLKVTLIGTRA